MQASVVGYPRVGTLRELKFATEKYFRKEISADVLQSTAKEIRKTQWLVQKNSGLDFIPSNDFSFYDHTLDAAVLFNIIPKRYVELELSPLDTYFAMARGQALFANRPDCNDTAVQERVAKIKDSDFVRQPAFAVREEIETALHRMLEKIPREKLWVNPDCGLKTRGETETVASLTNLVQAVVNIRKEL